MIQVHRIVNTPVPSNCFVVFDKAISNECVIVDPGTKNNEELVAYISKEELSPIYIILTHEHFDHCWGVNQIVGQYNIPIVCSELCADAIKYEKRNCSVFYDNQKAFTIKSETISVEAIGNELQFCDDMIRFFNTPGHTDASISFVADKYLFTGDTLIKDEKTVTKLPTGSVEKLSETVKILAELKGLGIEVKSGHGEEFILDDYDLEKMTQGRL